MPYHMVVIGGVARMSRPSSTPLPLPKVRCDRKVNVYVNVRDLEPTQVARPPSMTLPKLPYRIVWP